MKPLGIDLYCGLGGWTEGLLAESYDVVGFDNERHVYALPEMPEADGNKRTKPVEKRGWTQGCAVSLGLEGANAQQRSRIAQYPAQLVLQDVLTIHGSQFRNATLIVASPPCQAYSYMAMPWKRAKREIQWQKWNKVSPFSPDGWHLTDLFDACFRIQHEASEAAGHHIPMVVENVKGAQPWVGKAAWHYGSFYLWGDVPALMPSTRVLKNRQGYQGIKQHGSGPAWFDKALNERRREATNCGGDWFSVGSNCSTPRRQSSRGSARKAASAQIAKIPFELARWIAHVYHP